VSWWVWLLSIWLGVLLISLVMLLGFAVVDSLRRTAPTVVPHPRSAEGEPSVQVDHAVG
jgi:hypothetical protein